ncbi:NAD-dependent epimerase/dehydratase family protein [Ampullimonas aquatilis]|uniref:NAD-dependent epimerase/dehydratase family protein n=1 Tax=Ampullimonas aquatilis TaxID=1341549 RepID=UPI003C73CF10
MATDKSPLAFITGATGFVGQALCHLLLEKGWQIRAAVRSTSSENPLPIECEQWQCGNLTQTVDWQSGLQDVDYVFHLAAHAHQLPGAIPNDPRWYAVNEIATRELAKAAAKAQVKRLIFVSTIKVNGEATFDKPFTEVDPPNPQDDYAKSKLAGEMALKTVSAETGLDWTIIRPPLVYGPGVGANFMQLVKLVKTGIPLPLASVKNKRSLIYVGNLVECLYTCATHPNASKELFLVADEPALSVPELITQISQSLGQKRVPLFHFPVGLLRLIGRVTGKQYAVERLVGSLEIVPYKLQKMTTRLPNSDIHLKQIIINSYIPKY